MAEAQIGVAMIHSRWSITLCILSLSLRIAVAQHDANGDPMKPSPGDLRIQIRLATPKIAVNDAILFAVDVKNVSQRELKVPHLRVFTNGVKLDIADDGKNFVEVSLRSVVPNGEGFEHVLAPDEYITDLDVVWIDREASTVFCRDGKYRLRTRLMFDEDENRWMSPEFEVSCHPDRELATFCHQLGAKDRKWLKGRIAVPGTVQRDDVEQAARLLGVMPESNLKKLLMHAYELTTLVDPVAQNGSEFAERKLTEIDGSREWMEYSRISLGWQTWLRHEEKAGIASSIVNQIKGRTEWGDSLSQQARNVWIPMKPAPRP